jgi:hypothetical protein
VRGGRFADTREQQLVDAAGRLDVRPTCAPAELVEVASIDLKLSRQFPDPFPSHPAFPNLNHLLFGQLDIASPFAPGRIQATLGNHVVIVVLFCAKK